MLGLEKIDYSDSKKLTRMEDKELDDILDGK